MKTSKRFEKALAFAARLHAGQQRKGSQVPYVSHLLGVCALTLDHGATEDQAIAALLHDAVEDQGGRATLERIEATFGSTVAAMVAACTDNLDEPSRKGDRASVWRARKEAYLASISGKPDDALLVICADKLHNASAIVEDVRERGPAFLDKFAGGPEGVAWYYESLGRELPRAYPSRIAEKLADKCRDVARLARERPQR